MNSCIERAETLIEKVNEIFDRTINECEKKKGTGLYQNNECGRLRVLRNRVINKVRSQCSYPRVYDGCD